MDPADDAPRVFPASERSEVAVGPEGATIEMLVTDGLLASQNGLYGV